MTFKIITLGCKVNIYESEFMLEALLKAGFKNVTESPDIIIINTCSVTNIADSKSLKMVRREIRENKNALIVVAGCSSLNNISKYQNLGIHVLLGNQGKSNIVNYLQELLKTKEKIEFFNQNRNLPFEDMKVAKFTTHTRAFMKIEDGCDNFCSYCIIPYTRGSVRSKDFNLALKEAEELVKNGHKELVLTGIHTGAYNNNNHDLSDLLVELVKIKDLERLRISSIEITELNSKFLEVLKNNPKICNHLHIPLQSGSANILKRMNRKYNKEYFQEKIELIRSLRPDISITTDVIVGHPYETDTDFKECFDFCNQLKFSKIHVFPYSKRDGTAAATMPQVDVKIKKERAKELLELSNKLEHEYLTKFLNTEVDVLTEEYLENKNLTVGHTSNYLKVYLEGKPELNTIYHCQIIKIKDNALFGKLL